MHTPTTKESELETRKALETMTIALKRFFSLSRLQTARSCFGGGEKNRIEM
jgi:hypothetical protein